jgi:membrane associated rhomboid family serine protease
MRNASHTIGEELYGILFFIGAIWVVFILSHFFPSLNNFGLVPRTALGLVGIVLMPFLHGNIHHLLGNTIPLFIFLALLAGSKARSWEIVLYVALLGGTLLWIFGRNGDHIGVSGLIFGLISFLIVSGLLEKRILPLIISLFVGFFYGGTLLMGVLPTIGKDVSWDGHLCGAIAGALVAYLLTRDAYRQSKSIEADELKPDALLPD